MKICNPWKLFAEWQGRRPRLRRRSPALVASIAAEVLEERRLLTAGNVNLAVSPLGDITLTSTDANNPDVTMTRSGGTVVFTGSSGTQINYAQTQSAQLIVAIPAVRNITLNLGTGEDLFAMSGLSTTGDVTVNGKSSGFANIQIFADVVNTDVVIGGSIVANFGGEATSFYLVALKSNLSVNGSVSLAEAGPGSKATFLYGGTSAGNQRLQINGDVNIVDRGTGTDYFSIKGQTTINGNVSFDNSRNSAADNYVTIGVLHGAAPTIHGSLTLALSHQVSSGGRVILGTDSQTADAGRLIVDGPTVIKCGNASDNIDINEALFKSSVTINTGSSPGPGLNWDLVQINASEFDGPVSIKMLGPSAHLELAGDQRFLTPTEFKQKVTVSSTGPGAVVRLAQVNAQPLLIFGANVLFTGGKPAGKLFIGGLYSANPKLFRLVHFVFANG